MNIVGLLARDLNDGADLRLTFSEKSARAFKLRPIMHGHTCSMNTITARPSARIERYDTIVIGAGQAGLAVGHHLAKSDADFLILDAATRLGESWRQRWDSLRVFTSAAFTGLPGLPFPAAGSHLPDKDELADYLERYAQRFDLPIRMNTRVASLTQDGGRYIIDTGAIRYEARNVVVATGPFHTPRVPSLANEVSPDIHQMHSSDYRNPFSLPAGPVLVVGVGNAGGRIALEVSRFRQVALAGPRTGHVRRTFLRRDIHWWLWPVLTRLTSETRAGRLLRERLAHDPLVGISEADFEKAGIERRGRVTEVREGSPATDGTPMDVRTIIWCTGFAPDFNWIHLPLPLDGGSPRTRRGVVEGSPGLYFVGLRFLHTIVSALIGGVGADAAYIARRIIESEGQ